MRRFKVSEAQDIGVGTIMKGFVPSSNGFDKTSTRRAIEERFCTNTDITKNVELYKMKLLFLLFLNSPFVKSQKL